MDLFLFGALGLVVLLTVLIGVTVYVSRSIPNGPKSKRKKALLVLSATAVLLIVGVVGLGVLVSAAEWYFGPS